MEASLHYEAQRHQRDIESVRKQSFWCREEQKSGSPPSTTLPLSETLLALSSSKPSLFWTFGLHIIPTLLYLI